mmetsp:Transcript_73867/g.159780  ORF Transcript_73867/g.159780 Transcript_73867/m.159780 type:complete len:105 (+) Transcript_73867:342-656(+)
MLDNKKQKEVDTKDTKFDHPTFERMYHFLDNKEMWEVTVKNDIMHAFKWKETMDPQMGRCIFVLKDTDFDKMVASKMDTKYLQKTQLGSEGIKAYEIVEEGEGW